jgi:hypothetical protein
MLYFSNFDNWQTRDKALLASEDNDLEALRICKQALKRRWNAANGSRVDIEDIHVLYDCLHEVTGLYTKAMAKAFDGSRSRVRACINGTWENV